jgi:hypothetical protein
LAQLSTARKLSIAARLAHQHAKRSRTYGALMHGARATLSHFSRVLYQLWLEITGFVFLAFAAVGAVATSKEYSAYRLAKAAPGRVMAAALFSLVFAWFGVSSFWKARRRR